MCDPDRVVDVEDVMDSPEGLIRSGDEFHDPDNWVRCPRCRVGCPVDFERCFRCGAALGGGAA